MDVEQAVSIAKAEIGKLFPNFAGDDLQLEEAETPLSGARWRFTFSASVSASVKEQRSEGTLADLLRPRRTRKVIELESDSGSLVSIKAA